MGLTVPHITSHNIISQLASLRTANISSIIKNIIAGRRKISETSGVPYCLFPGFFALKMTFNIIPQDQTLPWNCLPVLAFSKLSSMQSQADFLSAFSWAVDMVCVSQVQAWYMIVLKLLRWCSFIGILRLTLPFRFIKSCDSTKSVIGFIPKNSIFAVEIYLNILNHPHIQ